MRFVSRPLLLAFVSIAVFAYSDPTAELQKSFENALKGKEVILRAPYAARQIALSADGTCTSGCDTGGWAEDGSILVKRVQITDSALSVLGERLLIFYDTSGARVAQRVKQPVEVTLALATAPNRQTASEALVRAFRASSEPQPTAAPPDPNHPEGPFEKKTDTQEAYYRRKGTSEWKQEKDIPDPIVIGHLSDGVPAYVVSKAVKPPHAVYVPDPEYSEQSRKQKHAGSVRLRIAVDDRGFVRAIQAEHADWPEFVVPSVLAVAHWRFEPATYDGKPVACVISVVTNFRLY
jgi:hypothetical protein